MMLKQALIVALGGGLGSVARFFSQHYIRAWHPHPFPFGTFFVNISGCFLIGLFFGLAEKANFMSPEWRLFLATGFCGGFTTFSAFALENNLLFKSGNLLYAGLYIVGSVVLCLGATWLGLLITKQF